VGDSGETFTGGPPGLGQRRNPETSAPAIISHHDSPSRYRCPQWQASQAGRVRELASLQATELPAGEEVGGY